VAGNRAQTDSVIKLKTAEKDMVRIRKGEQYCRFTGNDAGRLEAAATKLGISEEEFAHKVVDAIIESK
jgi:hypothetical protein